MAIFNSLGSNYSASDVWRNLFDATHTDENVTKLLADRFRGQVTLTYKGRQALQLAVSHLRLPGGSLIGINGFTCYVVYQAVERAGYKPILIDVPPRQLNFDLTGLKVSHAAYPELKAIIVQNTLGSPADMPAIEAYCQQHGIAIIEDLAHSFGAKYSDGREAGTVGKMTMLSFSQDKQLDIVAGGALVDRSAQPISDQPLPLMGTWQRWINRTYPFWTAVIRTFYPLRLGKPIHFFLKKLHMLATPMSDNLSDLRALDPPAIHLLERRLSNIEKEREHRRAITKIYQSELIKICLLPAPDGSNDIFLRFPIWVDDRIGLLAHLKHNKIHISDTWYDAPIAPKRYLTKTTYQNGDCPQAEALVAHIINLPTHAHVNEAKAHFIAGKVNEWLNSA